MLQTALVTGASTGIGCATALRLARSGGWKVFAGVRDQDAAERLRSQAPEGKLEPIALDVTDAAQVAAAAARVREHGEAAGGAAGARLDALVNNAGIGIGGPLELIPLDDLRRQLEVNVVGQVGVTQALLPALRAARGRIVFISSVGGRVPMAFTAPYAASKHAIEAIGDTLRVELRSSGVQVALVEPGSVSTPIWEKARESGEQLQVPPELQAEYGHVPAAMTKSLQDTARRGVDPDQVAAVIQHALRSRHMRSRYVVGRDARAMILLRRLLPDHTFDALARRALGV
jgi:NAD(P)-dependent dehydrogenase (short-subunit alcohol dehydrogenase family)